MSNSPCRLKQRFPNNPSVYTTVTLCSGTNLVVTATSTILSPCEKCAPGAETITITTSPESGFTHSSTSERTSVSVPAASASSGQPTTTPDVVKSSTSVGSSTSSESAVPSKTNVSPVSTVQVVPFVGSASGFGVGWSKAIFVGLSSIILYGLILL